MKKEAPILLKELVIQSSSGLMIHSAEITLRSDVDHLRIVLRDAHTRKEKAVFTGKKWNEAEFKEKRNGWKREI